VRRGAGVSKRSMQDWENGLNYPNAQNLEADIIVLLHGAAAALSHPNL